MIRGLVQGVGFRPFIFRTALKYELCGQVDNRSDGVTITVEGDPASVKLFSNDILQNAPIASHIKSFEINRVKLNGYKTFTISSSKDIENEITEVSPDIAVCEDCLDDMEKDPARIAYPFVNCTNCGPRFTIIEKLPYDRRATTMKYFSMCPTCKEQYEDVHDRRFHAQPVACNSCGPRYKYHDEEKTIENIHEILNELSSRISSGRSVAIKGLGGYHLMCDALNNNAVSTLRNKKNRDAKPFAIMFKDTDRVKEYCYLNKEEEKEIASWRRPIVILKERKDMAASINNGLGTIGAMLPYMPVHFLLFKKLKTPAIVLTSGNLFDEPIIICDNEAREKLMPIAGSIVTYNRDIFNRTDDSVLRIINGKASIIRRSRGYVPRPVDLCLNVDGILAVGPEQKNSFCIGRNKQAVMSQYIGDIKSKGTYDFFVESVEKLSRLFRFKPSCVACDLHPDYLSTRYAEELVNKLGIPLVRIQHHHAHIVSCMAEKGIEGKVIGVSLDGTGYGTDGNIWGGEFMIADMSNYTRYAHFDYVALPGGDKAIDEPWRMAYSYIHKYFGNDFDYNSLPLFRNIDENKLMLVRDGIEKNINSPLSSGAGRLFDAVSALLGLCTYAGFDAEAPMRLEAAIKEGTDDSYPFHAGKTIVFSETINAILDDIKHEKTSVISAKFHNTVARIILDVCIQMREENTIDRVVLSGGVFQNKYLLEKSFYLLALNGFSVFTNNLVPANDGGVSLGQIVITAKTIGNVS